MGNGGTDEFSTLVPTCAKNFYSPPGVAQISILAGTEPIFLKLWSWPLGECKNVPEVATTVCSSR